jgi:protein-tyrosine-phosphatase
MIEFKHDTRTNKWWLMEINGRLWGSLPLTIAAGVDMPLYWYQMLREERENFPQDYRVNLYCRCWAADRYWFTGNIAARNETKDLLTVSLFSLLLEVKHIISGNERSDTFVWDDPKPAAIELKQLFIEPIDTRMRKLLFVCYGNICRSPFAEKLGQLKLDIIVNSAGTHPQQGRHCPSEATSAALYQDVDLSTHRSKVLNKSMIEDADVILVFDLRNERAVLAQFPFSRSKVHLIGCIDDCGAEVEDPFGKGVDAFDFCYRRITKLMHHIYLLKMTHPENKRRNIVDC